ncbi:MAG: metallophosphoesterase [Oscillospiraceae bacterium]|nr:metallophosphoesterase [Oscillospiraceae bacterium]
MILATLLLGLAIVLLHVIRAIIWDRSIHYNEVPFSGTRVSAELDGYRIALVTDTHRISDARLQEIVDELNRRQIDLLLLGGDFARGGGEPRRTLNMLARVKTTDGIYGVEGNHDKTEELFAAMEAEGVQVLSNSGVALGEQLYLAGVADLWIRKPDIEEAIAGAGAEQFVLLLAHNPGITMRQSTAGVDLVLSGHTHGGEVTLFGVWAPAVHFVKAGHHFLSGWAKSRDGVPVYVCNGIGSHLFRVFARPEVTLLTLKQGVDA